MARRKRSLPRPVRKSRTRRPDQTWTATCASCGLELQLPVRPEADMRLTCVDCSTKARAGQG